MSKPSKLALFSLVSGALSFFVFVFSPIAIAVGLAAIYRIRRSAGSLRGRTLAISGLALGVAAFVFSAFVMLGYGTHYKSFKVPAASMSPTIKAKERIVVDLKAYRVTNPARGDIVTYEILNKGKRRLSCKRIVGLSGEEVEIRSGKIYINGAVIDIPGLPKTVEYINSGDFGEVGKPIKVPDGFYYVLGDNSPQSFDSRQHGPIDKKDIYGKFVFAYKWFDSKMK